MNTHEYTTVYRLPIFPVLCEKCLGFQDKNV